MEPFVVGARGAAAGFEAFALGGIEELAGCEEEELLELR